ncbi:MAG: LysM peptidoglycan-binding domain-containing protein [Chloroflexia bacterium]
MSPIYLNREAIGLIPWLVGSWLLAVVGGLLDQSGLWPRSWIEARTRIREGAFFFYAVVIPYAAVLSGFLAPERLGLAGFSWWKSLGRTPLLAGLYLLLAVWAWRGALRTGPAQAGWLARERRWVRERGTWVRFLLWAGAEQLHWAFYRTVPLLVWGRPAGLWLGLLLVAGERYSIPGKGDLRGPGAVGNEAWWWTKAVSLTAAYALLENLWACMVLQALLEGCVAWYIERSAQSQEALQPAAEGPLPLRRAVPASVLVLLLLVGFTWGAISPTLRLPRAEEFVQQPTVPLPTSTPTPTPYPTPRPTSAPTATPLPTATPTPAPQRTYVVQPGDTLNAIAWMFDVSVADLMQVNGITDPTRLQIGQVLVIP